MEQTPWRSRLVAVVFALVLAGCGDDGAATPPSDVGPGDAAPTDSGIDPIPDAGSPDTGATVEPPRDAGISSGCDPYFADSCPPDDKCSVVLDFGDPDDPDDTVIVFDCVPLGRPLSPGQYCAPNSRDATPEDRGDEVYYDDCAQGSFCAREPDGPLHMCRMLCGALTSLTCSEVEYCDVRGAEPFGICVTADGCDPLHQSGCDAGDACYLGLDDADDDRVTICVPPVPAPRAPGETCEYLDDCPPGTTCFDQIRADGTLQSDFRCRHFCALPGADAGVADCPGGQTCRAIPPFRDGEVLVPEGMGLCS